jgi:hypothetical protein
MTIAHAIAGSVCADAIINTAAARVPDDRVRITGRGRL